MLRTLQAIVFTLLTTVSITHISSHGCGCDIFAAKIEQEYEKTITQFIEQNEYVREFQQTKDLKKFLTDYTNQLQDDYDAQRMHLPNTFVSVFKMGIIETLPNAKRFFDYLMHNTTIEPIQYNNLKQDFLSHVNKLKLKIEECLIHLSPTLKTFYPQEFCESLMLLDSFTVNITEFDNYIQNAHKLLQSHPELKNKLELLVYKGYRACKAFKKICHRRRILKMLAIHRIEFFGRIVVLDSQEGLSFVQDYLNQHQNNDADSLITTCLNGIEHYLKITKGYKT